MSLPQIAAMLKTTLPGIARNASTKALPDWIVRLAALFNPKAKALAPMLGINRNASNEKAKSVLGWRPRSNEEALLATAESLHKFGNIK